MARWQWCQSCQDAANAASYVSVIERQVKAPWWILRHSYLDRKITDHASELDRLLKLRIAPDNGQYDYLDQLRSKLSNLETRYGGRSQVNAWYNKQNIDARRREISAILDVHHVPTSVCPGWADARKALVKVKDEVAAQGAIRTAPVSKSWGAH